jgi:hypothetical protein
MCTAMSFRKYKEWRAKNHSFFPHPTTHTLLPPYTEMARITSGGGGNNDDDDTGDVGDFKLLDGVHEFSVGATEAAVKSHWS